MQNIHTQFRPNRYSISEQRQCFMVPEKKDQPNKALTPDEIAASAFETNVNRMFEANERNQKDFERIEQILLDVIRVEASPELTRLFEDPNHRKRIIAFVKLESGRFRFLTKNAPYLAGKLDGRYENPEEATNAYKKRLERSVRDVVSQIGDAIEGIGSVRASLPGSIKIDEIIKILEARSNRDLLQQRQDAMVDIAKALMEVSSMEEFKKQIEGKNSIFDQKKALLTALESAGDTSIADLKTKLLEIADSNTIVETAKDQAKDVLVNYANISYSEESQEELKKQRSEVSKELTDVKTLEQGYLNAMFESQNIYLNKLDGDAKHVIEGAIVDGRFSQTLLFQMLGMLEVKGVDAAKVLQIGGLNSPDDVVLNAAAKKRIGDINATSTASELISVDSAKKILHTVLNEGLEKAAELAEWKKAEKEVPRELLEDIFVHAWDFSALEKHLEDDLHMGKTLNQTIATTYLRSRVPDFVSEFVINSGATVATGDIVDIARIEKLTADLQFPSAVRFTRFFNDPIIFDNKKREHCIKILKGYATSPAYNEDYKDLIKETLKKSIDREEIGNLIINNLESNNFNPTAIQNTITLLEKAEIMDQDFVSKAETYFEELTEKRALRSDVSKLEKTYNELKSQVNSNATLKLFPNLLNIYIGKIEKPTDAKFFVSDTAKDALYKMVAKEGSPDSSGKKVDSINKDRFVEVLSLLLLRKAGSNEKEVFSVAQKEAEELWKTFAGSDLNKVSKQNLKDDFEKLQIEIGSRTLDMYGAVRSAGLQDVSWAENIKGTVTQLVEDAKVGGPIWLDYFVNFKDIFTYDEKFSELVKKRKALSTVQNVLEEALSPSARTTYNMGTIVDDIRAAYIKRSEEERGIKATGAQSESKKIRAHALMLAKAYTYAHSELTGVYDIDSLDRDIQGMAMWLALEKQDKKGKDPDFGLKKAQSFILEFTNAPNHLVRLQEAHEAFMGRKTLPEGSGQTPAMFLYYTECLDRYQTMAKIEQGVYESYRKSIGNLYNAIKNNASKQNIDILTKELEVSLRVYQTGINNFEKKREGMPDPTLLYRSEFLSGYYNQNENLKPEERNDFQKFVRKFEVQEENEGADNTAWLWNKHKLSLKPNAILMLQQKEITPQVGNTKFPGMKVNLLNGSYNMDRWLNQGEVVASIQPLQLIINGDMNPEAKDALIRAYTQGRDVQYRNRNGFPKVMSRQDALRAVKDIRTRLQKQSENYSLAKEWNDNVQRLSQNPIERVMRASIETVQDMWSGDMVDKVQVIAAMGIGFWLIREIWKKGSEEGAAGLWKIAKTALIGVPLVSFANNAYRRQTGRDVLGEKLLFMNPQLRNSMLEQWRRSAVEDGPEKYNVLSHNAGIAAIGELTDEDDKITVKDLDKWRDKVSQSTSSSRFKDHAPENLDIWGIQAHLGVHGTEEEAYRVAFIAYDALCASVASIHNISGGIEERANWGANHIRANYIDFASQSDDPDLQNRLSGLEINMADVINSESPVAAKNGTTVLTSREWIDEYILKAGLEKAKRTGSQLVGKVNMWRNDIGEFSVELFSDGKRVVLNTAESVSNWFEQTVEKAGYVVPANFKKTIGLVGDAVESVGGAIAVGGPDVFEWTVDIATYGLEKAKQVTMNIYRMLLTNGLTGPLMVSIGNWWKEVTGQDIEEYWKTPEYLDDLAQYTNARTVLIEQIDSISDSLPDDFKGHIDTWVMKLAGVNSIEKFEELPAAKKLLYLDLLKRQMFCHIIDERIDKVDDSVEAGETGPIGGPLSIDWPEATDAFDASDLVNTETYRYLISHYNPVTIPMLIGNEELLEGTLKRYKDLHSDSVGGTFASWLLSAGIDNVLGRQQASEYLVHELAEYSKKFLNDAKEKLGENSEELKEYEAYLDTLLTNVIIETVLDTKTDPKDLKLMVSQAKDLFKQLYLRRGVAPSLDQIKNADAKELLKKFRFKDKAETPEILKRIANDKKRQWMLRGAELGEEDEDADEEVSVGNIFGDAFKKMSDDMIKKYKDKSLSPDKDPKSILKDIKDKLNILPFIPVPDADEIRKKIVEYYKKIATKPKYKDKAEIKQENANVLLSTLSGLPQDAPEIDKIKQTLVDRYIDPNTDPSEISQFEMQYRNEAVKQLLNKIAFERLASIQKNMNDTIGSMTLTDIEKKRSTDPAFNRTFEEWVEQLVRLYEMTNSPILSTTKTSEQTTEQKLTDAISRTLEFALYLGDNASPDADGNTYFNKYNAFLEKRKFINRPDDKNAWEGFLGTSRSPGRMDYDIRGNTNTTKQLQDAINAKNALSSEFTP